MGLENMRRWPMYIVFAVCILLLLSLFNSWGTETELRTKVTELSLQLQDCSKQQTACMEESLTIMEQRDGYVLKVNDLRKETSKLSGDVSEYRARLAKAEIQINHTHVDVELCTTELQSLNNLQASRTAMLETLRLDKDALTAQLTERKQKVEDLQKEIERLKSQLTTKSGTNSSVPSKVTPAAQPPKISPALNAHNPINEPVLENDAKEEIEDTNAMNDGNDLDPQIQ